MENKLYVGLTKSGKTNKIKNEVEKKILNGESMVILDNKNEYEELFSGDYEIIKFNLNDIELFTGYNPFYRASELYGDGKIDKAMDIILSIGNMLFKTDYTCDPFWDNSAKNLYISICLYLLETKNELNIKEILKVSISDFELYCNYVEKQDILSSVSILGLPIINSPIETRSGIVGVFNERMSCFAHGPQLLEKLCVNNDINFKDKNQVILFTNKFEDCFANTILEIIMMNIMNILLEQNMKYSFVLDNFDTILNKKEFNNIFNNCLSKNIDSIVGVRDINDINEKNIFKVM